MLWGYRLAFGDGSAFIGDLSVIGLSGLDVALDDGQLLFVLFQMMFAIITPALITGAFVERFKFSTYLVFLVLWITLVYAPIAHWVWAEKGWLFELGALDFAWGAVVHINVGWPRWPPPFSSASVATLRLSRTTSHMWSLVPPCSGSVGSASTPAQAWPPTVLRLAHSW